MTNLAIKRLQSSLAVTAPKVCASSKLHITNATRMYFVDSWLLRSPTADMCIAGSAANVHPRAWTPMVRSPDGHHGESKLQSELAHLGPGAMSGLPAREMCAHPETGGPTQTVAFENAILDIATCYN